MQQAVILEALRTPFGRRSGVLSRIRPDRLLADLLNELLKRSGVEPESIEDVVVGTVTQVGEQGANVGRQAVLLAGMPVDIPATTLNRMCSSSQQTVHSVSQSVDAGDLSYGIAAGVESMTRVPMFSDIAGGIENLNPKLVSRFDLVHQGESAERVAENWGISRQECDEFAARSHEKATRVPRTELVAVTTPGDNGEPTVIDRDEGVRDPVDRAGMAALKTIFRPNGNGVVTAGNASQISDGASALLIGDRARAVADGLRPRARFRARVVVGADPSLQFTGILTATPRVLKRAGLALQNLDWIEINEAFAPVPLMWLREFEVDPEKLNPWGGAIAHGHPLGATGGGLMAKMLAGLESMDGQFGLQLMCAAQGLATATIVERV